MVLEIVLTAIALVFIVEGLCPFASPDFWRNMLLRFISLSDKSIRILGLVLLCIGVVLMCLVHSGLL